MIDILDVYFTDCKPTNNLQHFKYRQGFFFGWIITFWHSTWSWDYHWSWPPSTRPASVCMSELKLVSNVSLLFYFSALQIPQYQTLSLWVSSVFFFKSLLNPKGRLRIILSIFIFALWCNWNTVFIILKKKRKKKRKQTKNNQQNIWLLPNTDFPWTCA